MIVRTVKNKENPYYVKARTAVIDKQLSWKAKGIHDYLMSKPDNWQANIEELAKASADGIDAVRSGVKELTTHGYMKRIRETNDKGQIVNWRLDTYEQPHTDCPDVDYPDVAQPDVDNPMLISNDKERVLNVVSNEKASADVPLSGAPPSSNVPAKVDYKELPPVKAYRDLHNRWPSMAQMKLIERAGVTDMGLWIRVIEKWAERGFKPNNFEGMLDWYAHPSKFEKRETKPQRTSTFVPPVATGETGNVYSRFAA